jgi:hypothetical protein
MDEIREQSRVTFDFDARYGSRTLTVTAPEGNTVWVAGFVP